MVRSAVLVAVFLYILCAGCAGNDHKPVLPQVENPEAEASKQTGAFLPGQEDDIGDETPVSAQPVEEIPAPVPESKIHKVWIWQESGDCLWNLSKKYYGDPKYWKKIYLANKDKIKDPRVIFPRQQLVIPPLEEDAVDQ